MNCQDLARIIDDYVDGELPRSRRDEASAHLARCPSCRSAEEAVRRIVSAAAALPEELPPGKDLWDRIDTRLDQPLDAGVVRPGASSRGRQALLAAAMIVTLLGAAAAGALFLRPGPHALSPPAGPDLAPAAGGARGSAPLDEAGQALLEAKQSLREAFTEQSGSLSPGTVKQVEENIRIIEAAVAEIQEALDKDPGNPQLRRLLMAARQREVAVLTKVTRTAASRQMRW